MSGTRTSRHLIASRCTHLTLVLATALGLFSGHAHAQEAPPPQRPHGPALLKEPGLMTSALDFVNELGGASDTGRGSDGFYPKLGEMITGAGWISAGPGYRQGVFDGHGIIDTYAQVSWRGYRVVNAGLEFPLLAGGRLSAGTEARWQDATQINYFGLGPESNVDLRSHYRLQSVNVVGYAKYRPLRAVAVGGRVGWLDHLSVSSATGPFLRDYLDTQTTFPNDPAMTASPQPSFLHGQLSVTLDTRDAPDHPTRGALYRAAVSSFEDRDLDAFSFRRYEVEGVQLIPLFGDWWTVALRGWAVFSDTSPGHMVPFYLTPSLGGANTIRGYTDYRFHDRHLLFASAESRFPLFHHVDAAVFVDTGAVAERVRDLGFNATTYGLGFRLHSHQSTTLRFDVAHGPEGWVGVFKRNDPLSLSRLARWVAAVPFVP